MTIDILDVSFREVQERVPPFHSLPPSSNAFTPSSGAESSSNFPLSSSAADLESKGAEGAYDLVIHVGVGKPADVKLEGTAQRWGYDTPDVEREGLYAAWENGVEGGRRGIAAQEWGGLWKAGSKEEEEEALHTVVKRDAVVDWVKGKGVEALRTSEVAG